jgi:hypothetical protein
MPPVDSDRHETDLPMQSAPMIVDLSAMLDDLPPGPHLAATLGLSRRTVDRLVARGVLERPLRGVVRRTGSPDRLVDRAAAVALVLPPGAVLCRSTVAWLLDVDVRRPGEHLAQPRVECAVPRGREPISHSGVRCYVTDLRPDDVTEIAGLPCTTLARTAVDLARWSWPGAGMAALDRMARAGLIDPAELLIRVERWRGHPHVARARSMIVWCDPLAESEGESWLRLRFLDAGFPRPTLQIPLADANGVLRYRLDLGYEQHRAGWEYDGEEYHDGLEFEARDRRRREEIERRWGWSVVGLRKNLVLGRSMALEYGVGEVIGMLPGIRRREW